MSETHCPNCTAPMESAGFTGYGTTIYNCPKCNGQFEIKVSKEPCSTHP